MPEALSSGITFNAEAQMRTRSVATLWLCCVFTSAALISNFAGAPGMAQSKPAQNTQRLIQSVKGPDLFRAHCAVCHGVDAKGKGPMAPTLKVTVPDLTRIAQRNRGTFPADRVRGIIAGDEVRSGHGSREMPIWGPIFHQVEWDQDLGNVRLENLTEYLRSLQQK
jgi:mono/diheme cytochrome c family protein